MKEHIKRIALAILSACMVLLLIHAEYNRENVTEETIKAIAQLQPYYFVMRDSSMKNDCVATNFEQIFATFSPDTVRKVL